MPAGKTAAKHTYPIEPSSLSAGPLKPRASIDDDNVEGDADLTSSLADADLVSNSSGGGFASDNYEAHYDDNDDDELDDDDDPRNEAAESPGGLKSRLMSAASSPSLLIPAPPNAFAPPFYNRPPTPLPPSPSLTSLLRPSFSSRPTTPDDSESEVAATAGEGSAAEAAVAKSARDARSVPLASPKVPTYEYYGFVLYLTSGLCFLMYLLWSYLPSPFLHQLGIYYYPNRWWSLAVPSFLVMLLVYIYVALAAYNTEHLTPPLGSIMNVVDEAANVAAAKSRNSRGKVSSSGTLGADLKARASSRSLRTISDGHAGHSTTLAQVVDWKEIWNEGTDAVMDIPIGGVCEVLYGTD